MMHIFYPSTTLIVHGFVLEHLRHFESFLKAICLIYAFPLDVNASILFIFKTYGFLYNDLKYTDDIEFCLYSEESEATNCLRCDPRLVLQAFQPLSYPRMEFLVLYIMHLVRYTKFMSEKNVSSFGCYW